MDTSLYKINAYILTGGQSRRLNTNKSLVRLNNKTLTEIIHQKLSSLFNKIYIVGKENNFSDNNFIEDINPIQCPMNGIATAQNHSNSEWIFIIACDMPLIKPNIINSLYDSINSNAQVIAPIVNNRVQPLCAFYHKSVFKNLCIAIEKGDFKLIRLLDKLEILKVTIPVCDEEQFLNINYPKDLNKVKEMLEIET